MAADSALNNLKVKDPQSNPADRQSNASGDGLTAACHCVQERLKGIRTSQDVDAELQKNGAMGILSPVAGGATPLGAQRAQESPAAGGPGLSPEVEVVFQVRLALAPSGQATQLSSASPSPQTLVPPVASHGLDLSFSNVLSFVPPSPGHQLKPSLVPPPHRRPPRLLCACHPFPPVHHFLKKDSCGLWVLVGLWVLMLCLLLCADHNPQPLLRTPHGLSQGLHLWPPPPILQFNCSYPLSAGIQPEDQPGRQRERRWVPQGRA